jgi:hypothetical protein
MIEREEQEKVIGEPIKTMSNKRLIMLNKKKKLKKL